MADYIDRMNASAIKLAKKMGHPVYSGWYADTWPTCIECNEKLRYAAIDSRYRACACPDVRWYVASDGWKKI